MKNILILFLLIFTFSTVYGGDASRKGTTGADQLLIPVGARSIATGGAFLANTMGVESIYYNPAGLSRSTQSEAMFSYMSHLADINVSYFAIGTNLGEMGSLGLSFKSFDFGDIERTTVTDPDGTGSTYSPSFFTVGLTYSKTITDRVSAGINMKLIHEGILNTEANGFALDFGVQYTFSNNLFLGVVVKNIGSNMSYGGQDLQINTDIPGSYPGSATGAYSPVTDEFQIPSYFQLSLAYSMNVDQANSLQIASSLTNNNAFEDIVNMGLEYSYSNILFIRGGYNYQLENYDESIYNYTVGAGLNYEMVDGIEIKVDYAFRNVEDFPSDNHILTLTLGIQ